MRTVIFFYASLIIAAIYNVGEAIAPKKRTAKICLCVDDFRGYSSCVANL